MADFDPIDAEHSERSWTALEPEPMTDQESSRSVPGQAHLSTHKIRGSTHKRGINIPRGEKAYYKHSRFVNDYHLRCDLEKNLLLATLALPNQAGIEPSRVAQLRKTLEGENRSLPNSEKQWEEDDLPRLHAIVTLMEARYKVGVEDYSTLDQWKALEVYRVFDRNADKRKRDPVVKELLKRKDGKWLKHLEKHAAFRASMQRFFENTMNLPKYGGLEQKNFSGLSMAFDGHHDRPDAIEAWWHRRNALIVILRARVKAKVRGEPELKGTWEGYELPHPESPTLQELCIEETGNKNRGETIGLGGRFTVEETEKRDTLYTLHEHELSPIPKRFIDPATINEHKSELSEGVSIRDYGMPLATTEDLADPDWQMD